MITQCLALAKRPHIIVGKNVFVNNYLFCHKIDELGLTALFYNLENWEKSENSKIYLRIRKHIFFPQKFQKIGLKISHFSPIKQMM